MEPEYDKYSLKELNEAKASIDPASYPERLEKINNEIKKKESSDTKASIECNMLDVSEAGVHLKINKELSTNRFHMYLSISYNFMFFYQKTRYEMEFSAEQLRRLITDLREGNKSWHGNSDIWSANKIFIKKPNHPFYVRNVRLYRRWFILGFNVVPTSLSSNLLNALYGLEV